MANAEVLVNRLVKPAVPLAINLAKELPEKKKSNANNSAYIQNNTNGVFVQYAVLPIKRMNKGQAFA